VNSCDPELHALVAGLIGRVDEREQQAAVRADLEDGDDDASQGVVEAEAGQGSILQKSNLAEKYSPSNFGQFKRQQIYICLSVMDTM
jgi:hypothetical protein